VILEQWDTNPTDQQISRDEIEAMIDPWTGDNLTIWPVPSNADIHFAECDTLDSGILGEDQVESCYNMNCDRYCRADSTSSNGRRLSTAAGSADYSNWCMCINYNYDVLFRDYDTSIPKDNSLTKEEFSEMFDAASDFFYINWPSKAQLYFEECDTDGNNFMEGDELTDCYTLNCDRECIVSNTVTDDDIRMKKWCGCRYNDYTVVMEQWDVSPLD
jgi:hypothetical protein